MTSELYAHHDKPVSPGSPDGAPRYAHVMSFGLLGTSNPTYGHCDSRQQDRTNWGDILSITIYIMYKCIGGLNVRMQMRLQKEVENIRYDRCN